MVSVTGQYPDKVQVLPEAGGSMQESNPQQLPHLRKGNTAKAT